MKVVLNSDSVFVAEVRKRILENDGYCPCATVHDEDTKCMCKNFREQEYKGECHCGLYIKVGEDYEI